MLLAEHLRLFILERDSLTDVILSVLPETVLELNLLDDHFWDGIANLYDDN